MSKPKRINKSDIGHPSNFVHIKHVGFGMTASGSTDLTIGNSEQSSRLASERNSGNASELGHDDQQIPEQSYKVERRNKGNRQSLIPRHHRSTTTCIFPSENAYSLSRGENRSVETRDSIDTSGGSSQNKSSLKPFGSLLNLSFLPLGLGKSSSKSPSIGKTKRMSLLNLTANNLFTAPKATHEENRETVHMTGYTRRRSLSNSREENEDSVSTIPAKPVDSEVRADISNVAPPKPPRASYQKEVSSTRIPLAKLGRSKSSMAEFSKRPKLRLKIAPPPVAPPPAPQEPPKKPSVEAESLPSPPPSPLPSPPPSPTTVDGVPLRMPKPIQRPRIIPLPSTSSIDSADPSSPQYLTPAGGCSPQANINESEPTFPLLSPTIPPSSTPFFSPSRSAPGTPPVWPLQPNWPSTISMQRKEASIPEIPSPCQEEMETSENEYIPVMSIVNSFISEESESCMNETECKTTDENKEDKMLLQNLPVSSANVTKITSVLRETVEFSHWPCIAHKLFQSIQTESSNGSVDPENDVYTRLLTKTLELWSEMAGEKANLEKLVTILKEENLNQATDSLQEVLQDMHMTETQ